MIAALQIWATDFTEPMSMPSSKVEVQIAVVGKFPALSRSSSSSLKVLERLPWWGKNSLGTFARSDRRRSLSAVASTVRLDPPKTRLFAPLKVPNRWSEISSKASRAASAGPSASARSASSRSGGST